MIKYFIFVSIVGFMYWVGAQSAEIEDMGDMEVQKVLEDLGAEKSPNYPDRLLPGANAEIGENIIKFGNSKGMDGAFTARQSKHFVCTSCHNVEKETAYLDVEDPQERLLFTAEKGLPFVQGSPLYGIVNRTSFYNGDYEKKYGDLVDVARNDIREAIQLCAVECSQGRSLKPWEVESILMYLWQIGLKVKDFSYTESELDKLESAIYEGRNQQEVIALLKSKYLDHAPATFVNPPENYRKGFTDIVGNPENGKLIYENGCLHCHMNNDYSYYELDNEKLTFKQLKSRMKIYDQRSFYHVNRYGTKPKGGRKAYMPHYTKEKMSDQQLEDLREYILQSSK